MLLKMAESFWKHLLGLLIEEDLDDAVKGVKGSFYWWSVQGPFFGPVLVLENDFLRLEGQMIAKYVILVV